MRSRLYLSRGDRLSGNSRATEDDLTSWLQNQRSQAAEERTAKLLKLLQSQGIDPDTLI
jgi:Tfp pilus assembly protein PilP